MWVEKELNPQRPGVCSSVTGSQTQWLSTPPHQGNWCLRREMHIHRQGWEKGGTAQQEDGLEAGKAPLLTCLCWAAGGRWEEG